MNMILIYFADLAFHAHYAKLLCMTMLEHSVEAASIASALSILPG